MKMFELVQWFQLEYPELVSEMKRSDHHLNHYDKCSIDGIESLGYDENVVDYLKNMNYAYDINPYHIESDVFTHTMLVCKQAENMPYEVQIAALLHDIGKPSTRKVNPKNGRVSFFNHDAVSAFMSLEILNREELGLSKEQKILIFNMITLHTQIYKLSIEKLAAIGDNKLVENLILLGNADHEGRFHSHEGAEIPTMEDISGISSTKRSRETTKEVHILCGLPASGKSTWMVSNRDRSEVGYVVTRDGIITEEFPELSYDEAWKAVSQKRVDKLLQEEFKEAKKYENVTVDMTHMSKKSRRRSLSHFGSEYKKICHVFLTDLPTINLRNSQREGKVIGKDVYEKMMRSFYPPTYEEFDEIIYHL